MREKEKYLTLLRLIICLVILASRIKFDSACKEARNQTGVITKAMKKIKTEKTTSKDISEIEIDEENSSDGKVYKIGEIKVKCTFGEIPLEKMLSDLIYD